MKLEELKNKKILILGFGKEGRDTLKFLKKLFPKKALGVGDRDKSSKFKVQSSKLIRWHLGKNYLRAIKNYDIIIKSPGIPIHLPEIEKAYKQGKITSQTEIFLKNCPGKIVGVTGTKGKSTTTALIYKILKGGSARASTERFDRPERLTTEGLSRMSSPQGGRVKAHLVGNIGKPVLNLLLSATKKDVYVYELSSHQLYNLKKSPQIVVFLNIYPEHFDYYKNFEEYKNAKGNITKYQSEKDYLIYNFKDKNIRKIAKSSKAKKIPIKNHSDMGPNRRWGGWRAGSSLKNVGISKTPLLGKHNLLNIVAAIEVGKIFGIPKEKIKKAIENFKPLPHRLELVGTFKGITFYNDALSTIPETTIAALDALGDKVETIVLGGFDRGLDFSNLAKRILKSKIKNLILFPTTGEKIWKALRLASLAQGKKLSKHFFVDNMKEAVKLAYQNTQKGKVCLLSCASTSFSIFRDYKEKGNLFKKYVKRYGKI